MGLAPIHAFYALKNCDAKGGLSDEDLASLLKDIFNRPGGGPVAFEILYHRLSWTINVSGEDVKPALIVTGRRLLQDYDLIEIGPNQDYRLAEIVKACFASADAADEAYAFCRHLAAMIDRSWSTIYDIGRTAASLALLQPVALLNAFLGEEVDSATGELFDLPSRFHPNPLLAMPRELLLGWADGDPVRRYVRIAKLLGLFPRGADDEAEEGDQRLPLVLTLLDRAPDKAAMLAAFEESLMPRNWSGNLSDLLEDRRRRLGALRDYADEAVKAWANKTDRRLSEWVESERQREREAARRERSFE
jgi:hypothetical protein